MLWKIMYPMFYLSLVRGFDGERLYVMEDNVSYVLFVFG